MAEEALVSVFVDRLDEEAWHDGRRDEAFAALYEERRAQLVAYCRRLLGGHHEDAEAFAQEAFTRAWAALDQIGEPVQFWAWVTTTARNLCIDHQRTAASESRRRRLQPADIHVQPGIDTVVEQREERDAVVGALQSLSPRDRRLVVLRDIEGWSYARIAGHEGTSVEAVRSALKRARAALRRAYGRLTGFVAALVPSGRGRIARTLQQAVAAAPGLHVGDIVTALALVVTSVGTPTATAEQGLALGLLADTPSSMSTTAQPLSSNEARAGGGGGGGGPSATPPTTPFSPPPNAVTHLDWPRPLDGGDSPEAGHIGTFASTSDGGTMFAGGFAEDGSCDLPRCPALFRSTDGGYTWHRLPAVGYDGGTLLVAPGRPSQATLFSATATTLAVSDDGGTTFRLAAGVGGAAAVSPAFASGDPRVLIGRAGTSWEYRHDRGTVTPLTWGSSTSADRTFEFSPSYPADPRVLEAADNGTVAVCRPSGCSRPAMLEGVLGAPRLRAAPSFARTGLAFAWHGTSLFRTADGGATFSRLRLPARTPVADLAFGPDGAVYLGLHVVDEAGRNDGGLYVSRDRGSTWSRLGEGTSLAGGAVAVTVTPRGIVIAALNTRMRGVLCSSDGLGWVRRCF